MDVEIFVEFTYVFRIIVGEHPPPSYLAKNCAEISMILNAKLVESRFAMVVGRVEEKQGLWRIPVVDAVAEV